MQEIIWIHSWIQGKGQGVTALLGLTWKVGQGRVSFRSAASHTHTPDLPAERDLICWLYSVVGVSDVSEITEMCTDGMAQLKPP